MTGELPLGSQTLEHYLEALASSQPAPGGGSAAAVAAALGAALGEMVCNITLARPATGDRSELEHLGAAASALRARFLQLAADDEATYGTYRAAARLPKATANEQETRRDAMQQALDAAAAVPLALAESCGELLDTLLPIARLGSRSVVSDAQTGAYLAAAAVQAAGLNLHANAALFTDRAAAVALVARFEDIAGRIPGQVQAVDEAAVAG